MREIKFRGKDEWGNWREGDLIYATLGAGQKPMIMDAYDEFDPNNNMFEVTPDLVGQFTGLKDSEGREIYEGDILGASKTKVIVEWGVDGWVADCFTLLEWLKLHESYVIGNVYDNPELLEVTHD